MKKLIFLLLCGIVSVEMQAQRRLVVIDMDTNLPVRDVSVRIDSQKVKQTDYLGRIDIPIAFDSIAFSHMRYEYERITMAELGDTMFLLPKEHMLPEVKVSAIKPELMARLNAWVSKAAKEGAALAPSGGASFDFADLIDRRGRRDRKHLERAKKILKEWDEKPNE
ncbi:MAG: hypothetical protein IKS72_06230 [Prevotella sp.]|nr:hypothetical protein [Prevotella sp.]